MPRPVITSPQRNRRIIQHKSQIPTSKLQRNSNHETPKRRTSNSSHESRRHVTTRPTQLRAGLHPMSPGFPERMCRRVFRRDKRHAQCGASLLHFEFLVCRRRTKLPWERALCQVGRRTRFLNCERFERRYAARNDGFFASRRRRKCAQSNRVAASAVSVSALRRELPRSHKHRVCDAWNERRPGFKRFSVWHGQRNFFYWIFCAANSRGAAGGKLER